MCGTFQVDCVGVPTVAMHSFSFLSFVSPPMYVTKPSLSYQPPFRVPTQTIQPSLPCHPSLPPLAHRHPVPYARLNSYRHNVDNASAVDRSPVLFHTLFYSHFLLPFPTPPPSISVSPYTPAALGTCTATDTRLTSPAAPPAASFVSLPFLVLKGWCLRLK